MSRFRIYKWKNCLLSNDLEASECCYLWESGCHLLTMPATMVLGFLLKMGGKMTAWTILFTVQYKKNCNTSECSPFILLPEIRKVPHFNLKRLQHPNTCTYGPTQRSVFCMGLHRNLGERGAASTTVLHMQVR
jgi:hypothetical protein